jgi:mono/diheme cytochrome c family protein
MWKSFLLFSAAILVTFALMPPLGGMSQDATPAPAPTPGMKNPFVKPNPESQAKAKRLYSQDCAMCHGDNGNGKTDLAKDMSMTLGDWTDPKTLANTPDSDMFNAIRNGKGKMPAEAEGRAGNNEVWHLILYIRSMSKSQPAAPAAAPNN